MKFLTSYRQPGETVDWVRLRDLGMRSLGMPLEMFQYGDVYDSVMDSPGWTLLDMTDLNRLRRRRNIVRTLIKYDVSIILGLLATGISGHPPQISPARFGIHQSISPVDELKSRRPRKSQYRLTTLQIAYLELRVAMSVT